MARYVAPTPPMTPEAEARISALAILAFDRALASMDAARDVVAFDRQTLRRFDVDGRMHVEDCAISKANVCPYFGREIPNWEGLGLDPNRVYKLYRDPGELERGADTFRNLQLLMIHTRVNANDPKTEVTVGTIGSDVKFVAPYLRASIAVWTAEAIKLIESKQQAQLSCSYRYRADMTPGTSPEGVAYDGVMRDIMGNHVALVENGRAGPDVFVSDSLPSELSNMKRSHIVAAAIAGLSKAGVAVTLDTNAQLALDAAIDAAMCNAEDEAEKKRKEAEDAANAAMTAGPQKGVTGLPGASDEQIKLAVDAALTGKGYVTKTDADKLAADAASAAVARVNALHVARKDVEPLVGVVAMDSAAEVYTFALKQAGVAFDGVNDVRALALLVEQVKATKAAKTAAPAASSVKLAHDAAVSVSQAIPGLGRFQVQ